MLRPLAPLALILLCTVACKDDDTSTGTLASYPLFPTAAMTEADASSGDAPTSTDSPDATTATPDATSADATSADPSSADATSAGPSTSAASEASAETSAAETSDDTTAPAPTDGPGLLPGETGLDAFCRRYVECGGTYYDGAQACIDESLGYWGECASRRAALDAFGECMSFLECSDWDPDAYNPNSTPCAQEWSDLGASEPCN